MTSIQAPLPSDELAAASFRIETSPGPVAMNKPQQMGTRLWAPMLAMALMGFTVSIVLAAVHSNIIGNADPDDAATIETLRHLVPGFMFLGFTGVFAAVSFAIARILGVFRVGGGNVQDDVGAGVQTLEMPTSAKALLVAMMMGMMAVAAGSVVHLVVGLGLPSGADESQLLTSERWFLFAEGLRRVGIGLYLVGITFGLATIIQVISFQSVRIRELVRA